MDKSPDSTLQPTQYTNESLLLPTVIGSVILFVLLVVGILYLRRK